MLRTYVDSCVWIAAVQGEENLAQRALDALDDPSREILFSDLTLLETLPKPLFSQRTEQVAALGALFAAATKVDAAVPAVFQRAMDVAASCDLSPMDALHAGAALVCGAHELLTAEKPTKPMFRMTALRVRTIFRDAGEGGLP
jgi:predicted nucleic acid-binding protein